jgi:hypothetical protein
MLSALQIGFVPGGKNAMNFAQALGIFLSFYAEHAPDVSETKKIAFPGTVASYDARHTEIGQQTLARAHIFASGLSGSGEIYNVGDCDATTGSSWREKWPTVCSYFGLEGTPPNEGLQDSASVSVSAFMFQHKPEWELFERKHNLRPGTIQGASWNFLEVLLSLATFDRQYDLSKFAAVGFRDRVDLVQNYVQTFDLMKAARMIP